MPDLYMHVNYFEGGYSMDQTFDKVLEYGFDGVELRGFSRDGLCTDEYLGIVQKEMDRTGLTNVVLSLNADFMQGGKKWEDELNRWSDVLQKGIDMGVRTFNSFTGTLLAQGTTYIEFDKNGSGCATLDQWELAIDAYKHLGAIAEKGGARIAFETHNCYLHDLATPTKKLLDMIDSPAVGANVDMGNIVLNVNGETLENALEILNSKIYYIHLKNMIKLPGGGFLGTGMGDGCINNRAFLRILHEQGYAGIVCLEAPRAGDRDHFAQSDLAYTKAVCEYLGWE